MVIVRQETLLLHRGKGKFVPCYAILAHNSSMGPVLGLYSDSTAKKLIHERLTLATFAQDIRFGSTCWGNRTGTSDEMANLLRKSMDPRVDKSLLISMEVPIESNGDNGRAKRHSRAHGDRTIIWLCALTATQMFDFIIMLADSLCSMPIPVPVPNQSDSMNALRHYKPKAFQARNDWERFWENPSTDERKNGRLLTEPGIINIFVEENGGRMETRRERRLSSKLESNAAPLTSMVTINAHKRYEKVQQLRKANEMGQVPFVRETNGNSSGQESAEDEAQSSELQTNGREAMGRRTFADAGVQTDYSGILPRLGVSAQSTNNGRDREGEGDNSDNQSEEFVAEELNTFYRVEVAGTNEARSQL